jgi:hypothetical protein
MLPNRDADKHDPTSDLTSTDSNAGLSDCMSSNNPCAPSETTQQEEELETSLGVELHSLVRLSRNDEVILQACYGSLSGKEPASGPTTDSAASFN